ncbi:hypothetical protein PM082_014011 [Marasmius tenuissimus]|nr:hypothetical protein PM082_014011 [Marasmius tenuissimus]
MIKPTDGHEWRVFSKVHLAVPHNKQLQVGKVADTWTCLFGKPSASPHLSLTVGRFCVHIVLSLRIIYRRIINKW